MRGGKMGPGGGERVTRWGLFLMRGVNSFFFFFSFQVQSLFIHTRSLLGLACLNRFPRLVIWVLSLGADFDQIYYWVFVRKRGGVFFGLVKQARLHWVNATFR